jgi:hypothetical protein
MGQEYFARGVLLRRVLLAVVVLVPLGASVVRAQGRVSLTAAPRTDLLFSSGEDPDCTELSAKTDAELPLHVVRLRALVDGAPLEGARYVWSLPQPEVGILAADLPLGPEEQTSAIRGLCAEFGNACVLTADKLPFYNLPTVLWIAPDCDSLPRKTTGNFAGGNVRIRVRAFEGKRKLGKATVSVGYGRTASVVLYANGQTGVGKPDGVNVDILPQWSSVANPGGVTLPEIESIGFDNGDTAFTEIEPAACTVNGIDMDVCTSDLIYTRSGRFVATVTQKFVDGSALCDNITTRVGTCEAAPKLQVTTDPKRKNFASGEEVHLRVRLINASPRDGGCNFLLTGSNVLTCVEELDVGGTKDSRTTVFDLQHCSGAVNQGCTIDAQCRPPICGDCDATEVCLTQPHCSETVTQACTSDSDCDAPACEDCNPDETCVKVLQVPEIVLPVGESIDLVDSTMPVQNVFPDVAKLIDKWTVKTFNAGSADAKIRYRIRGTRRQQ